MDKDVIFAVAGSGKTSLIIDQLDLESRALVITYTITNLNNLKNRIIEKFGKIPPNIRIYSYFNFLYSFCYKPYLHYKFRAKGINYDPCKNKYAKYYARYIDSSRRLYSNRIAKLLEVENVLDVLKVRLEKYYDQILIDEVQDFAGNDFNLLKTIVKANVRIVCVGDFYQHTFDTSRDGAVNKNLHADYDKYKDAFKSMGYSVDDETLSKSYRCGPSVCGFVTSELGISIESHRSDETDIYIVKDQEIADDIFKDNGIVKLFYKESYKYDCNSNNWGNTKGEDKYNDVCVVLNKTTHKIFEKLEGLVPQTKNKLYVAVTRTKKDLYFVPDELYKKYKK